jgi:glucose-6-phosphate 1-dehydrogenase
MTERPRPADPCTFVIFGATGDLTERLLMPAIYHLKRDGLLSEDFNIVGVSRRQETGEQFRDRLKDRMQELADEEIVAEYWNWLASHCRYLGGDLNQADTYAALKRLLQGIEAEQATKGNCLFYLAVPASEFAPVVKHLAQAGCMREDGYWRRLVIEKPFGSDVETAHALNRELLSVLDEHQIYRIDHYLGKETVRNIVMLRFGNGIFEPVWNREHIDHVEITVAETVGVERRGRFYDATGALRDMVPNHLFQLLTLTAMEPPTCFEPNAFRNEKGKVLDSVHHFTREAALTNVVRAQYGAGTVQGKPYKAYREEPDVASNSMAETYVAMKLTIDNWRWAGVPFYLRTGKALAIRKTDIVIQFKQAPLTLFRGTPVECLTRNDLTLNIQPEEGIALKFGAKIPGPQLSMGDVEMTFNYRDYFHAKPSTGYETLLYDCMIGDATLFQTADNIESAWRIVQPILDAWKEERLNMLSIYPAGSEGPPEADELIQRDERSWRKIVNGATRPASR